MCLCGETSRLFGRERLGDVRRDAPELLQRPVFGDGFSKARAETALGTNEDVAPGGLLGDELHDGGAVTADAKDLRAEGVGEEVGEAFAQNAMTQKRSHGAAADKGVVQLVLTAGNAEDALSLGADGHDERIVSGGVAGVETHDKVGRLGPLGVLDVGALEVDRALKAKRLNHGTGALDDTLITVDAEGRDLGPLLGLGKIGVEGEGEIGLATPAVDDGEGGRRGLRQNRLQGAQQGVDLIILAAHGGADGAVRRGDAEDAEERRGVEVRERLPLGAVVTGGDDGGRRGLGLPAGNERGAAFPDANVEVALRGDEVELALAGLRQDVLQSLAGGGLGEVAGLGLGAIAHLGLPEVLSLDANGADGDAERLTLTGEGLGETDEAGCKDAAADFIGQSFGKGVGIVSHGKSVGCLRRAPGVSREKPPHIS